MPDVQRVGESTEVHEHLVRQEPTEPPVGGADPGEDHRGGAERPEGVSESEPVPVLNDVAVRRVRGAGRHVFEVRQPEPLPQAAREIQHREPQDESEVRETNNPRSPSVDRFGVELRVDDRERNSQHQRIGTLQEGESNPGEGAVGHDRSGVAGEPGEPDRDESGHHRRSEEPEAAEPHAQHHQRRNDDVEVLLDRQRPQVPHRAVVLLARMQNRQAVGEEDVVRVGHRRGRVFEDLAQLDHLDAEEFADGAEHDPHRHEQPHRRK